MSADRGTRHLGVGGWLRLLIAGALVLIFLMTMDANGAAGASSGGQCLVRNASTGQTYKRLGQAVVAARPGARLVVTGRCNGGTFIDRDITIVGRSSKRAGRPILDGRDRARVLTIKPKVKVNVRSLVVRDGSAARIPNGGGISNRGRLTLRDVVVRDNHASGYGGGIHNQGVLRMRGRSVVKHNTAYDMAAQTRVARGSGVFNTGRLILDDQTRIHSNTGTYGLVNSGTLVMNDTSDIRWNDEGKDVSGVSNTGDWTMNDASSISEQGPVSNSGTFVMNDTSSVHHNRISGGPLFCDTGQGGGVDNTGALTLNDSAGIHHNVVSGGCGQLPAPSDRARGGGVYNRGSLTMTGASRIRMNEARTATNGAVGLGGGLYNASGGTLHGVNCAPHTDANVYGNSPDDCHIE